MGILRLFGPSKDGIWGQIADDIGGEYIDAGFWGKDVLVYKHKEWEVILDTYTQSSGQHSSTTYTRLRVPFVNKDGLRFKLSHENFLSPIGKFFGMQDIQIGDKYFDDKFIIKANDTYKIKQLLRDQNLKTLFDQQPSVHIHIKDNEGWFGQKYPDNVDVLYFHCTGVIKDKNALYNLFELFTAILDRLVNIDSAYETDPRIQLK